MDAFPLPGIDETLQPVHNRQWLTSFNLVQGYLQMPLKEVDVKKTTFRARSSALYIFFHMLFRLSTQDRFRCLKEVCLDDTFITLAICVFAASIDRMLDTMKLVQKRLKEFNLKINSRNCYFIRCSVTFLGYVVSPDNIS